MKSIINWTFGSFFRTLGRLLCFLLIGVLIASLISKLDLKLPSFFDLMYLNVDAMQVGGVDYYMPSDVKLYNNLSKTNSSLVSTSYMSGSTIGTDSQIAYYYGTVSTTTGGYGASWCLNAPFTFMNGYIYNVQIVVDNDNNREFNIVSNDNYDMLRLGYSASNASTHSDTTTINFFGAIYDSSGVYINSDVITSSGVYVLTYLFTSKLNSQFICLPFKHTTNSSNEIEYFYGAKFDIVGQSNLVTNASLNSAISNSGLASASSVQQVQSSLNQVQQEVQGTQNAINEQTEQQQENHEETINTLTDDSTDDKSSFFSNFQTSDYGLTSFITAPVNFIKSLTTNCSPITIPVLSQDITLPCGDTVFWGRADVADFRTFWNYLFVGVILFTLGIRMFKTLESAFNPRDFSDGFDVMAMNSETGEVFNKRVGKGIFRK